MKPVNTYELRKAHQSFFLYFALLIAFSVLCVFFFFATSRYEISLLSKRVKDAEKLLSVRKEINTNMDIILLRFKELGRFTSNNSIDISNYDLVLNDIQNSNQKIKQLVNDQPKPPKSFELYKKLSSDIGIMASIQDSLTSTRFQIESLRTQLEACNKWKKGAIKEVKGGLGKR